MPVYVITKTVKDNKYLYVVDITVNKDGKRSQKLIKSYGNLEKAKQSDPDIVEKLKQKYHCDSVAGRLEKTLSDISEEYNSTPESKIINAPVNPSQFGYSIPLNYGIRALYPIWNDDLKLDYKLTYLQKNNSDYQGRLSDIAFYLTALKVISPSSQLKAYQEQTKYLYDPLQDVPLSDLYNTLSFVEEHKDAIMQYLNNRICSEYGREMTMVFYDCTNVYFETTYDDKQRLFRLLVREIKKQYKDKSESVSFVDELEFEPDVIDEAIEQMKNMVNEDTCFRMRGLSKEHRYDLPLVSIALVIDTNGIPIDFKVFPGNISEFKTMPQVVAEMVEKYHVKNTIVVADRGLNSVSNLCTLNEHNLGFIVAQKVSNLSDKYEKQMLEMKKYKTWNSETREAIEINEELFENTMITPDLMFRRVPFVKSGYVTDEDGNKTLKKIECEIMFTFSKKRYERDIAQIENDEMLARKAVAEKKDMAPTFSSGWRSLVRVKKEEEPKTAPEQEQSDKKSDSQQSDKKSKDNKSTRQKKDNSLYRAESIKEDVLAKRKRLAGFAAVVYKSAEEDGEKELKDEALMESYHKLVKIEECFRIMKSNFTVRPVYVRKKNRIIGHITLCVLALIMTRLLEIKLKKCNYNLSVNEIQEALKSTVTAVSTNGTDGMFIKNNVINNVFTKTNMQPKSDEERYSDPRELAVSHYIENLKENKSDIDKIMEAVNLTPLPNMATAIQLCDCLKIRGSYQHLIGTTNSSIQNAYSQK